MKIFVTLAAGDRRMPYPSAVKIGVNTIGIAQFDPETRQHFLRLPFEEYMKHALPIARACALPGNVWYVSKVEVEDNGTERENELAQELDKAQAEIANLQREVFDAIKKNEDLAKEIAALKPTGPTSVSEIARQEEEAKPEVKPAVEQESFVGLAVEDEAPTEESLKALGGMRKLRAFAKEKGVPNYTTFAKEDELIAAILAYVNKPAEPEPAPAEQPAAEDQSNG